MSQFESEESVAERRALETTCRGIEHAVDGVTLDCVGAQRLADNTFMVPITFDSKVGDPLPIMQWFHTNGMTLESNIDGCNPGAYVFTLSIPVGATSPNLCRRCLALLGPLGVLCATSLYLYSQFQGIQLII